MPNKYCLNVKIFLQGGERMGGFYFATQNRQMNQFLTFWTRY